MSMIMKFNQILLFYDQIQMFTAISDSGDSHIFMALDEEGNYVGFPITQIELMKFLNGDSDLRDLMKESKIIYKGYFSGKEQITAELFTGELTEEMLPAEGLRLS